MSDYKGTVESHTAFEERVYAMVAQGIPFICGTDYLIENVHDAAKLMERLDPVTERIRFHSKATGITKETADRWAVIPKVVPKVDPPQDDQPEPTPPQPEKVYA